MKRRWLLGLAWTAALGAAVVILAAWWLIATPGGARLVLDRIALAAGKGARIGGVEGRLGGPLRIGSIEISRPDLDVRIDALAMETEPLEWRRLLVHRLRA